MWDLGTGQAVATLEGHTGPVTELAVTPDARRAVSGSDDTLRVWDLATEHVLALFHADGPIIAVACAGALVIAGSADRAMHFLDLKE